MDDLIADFVAECREMLEALGGEIVAWETQPDDRARLDSIFRFVHTVKGNCGFFEFPRLEALSHAAEDALADVRAGRRQPDGQLVSAVLGVIDRIAEMISAIEAGEEMPAGDDSALIEALAPGAEGTAAPAAVALAQLPTVGGLLQLGLSSDWTFGSVMFDFVTNVTPVSSLCGAVPERIGVS